MRGDRGDCGRRGDAGPEFVVCAVDAYVFRLVFVATLRAVVYVSRLVWWVVRVARVAAVVAVMALAMVLRVVFGISLAELLNDATVGERNDVAWDRFRVL